MTTGPAVAPVGPVHQVWLVLRRSMRDAVRDLPLAFVAPTLLAAAVSLMFASVFEAVADTPGFPSESFVDWVAPATVLLSAFVGAGFAASGLLRDIRSGYLDRMRLLPLHPAALVVGRAVFEGVRIVVPASVVLALTLAAGAENHGGAGAFVGIVAVTAVVATAWNGIFFATAIITRDDAAVIGLQPLFMPLLMFSTFFAPAEGAPGWFRRVVEANPFTWLLDGVRPLLTTGTVDAGSLAAGLGTFLAFGAVMFTLAGRAYVGLVRPD